MFLQTGEAESAEAICTDVLVQCPEDANFLCLSARALLKLGRLDEAQSALEEALQLLPEYSLENTRASLAAADPEFRERYIDGLRMAGLPEGTEA